MMLTVLEAYQKYIEKLTNDGPQKHRETILRSGLVRFFVPGLGGPEPKGKRSSSEEIKTALNFLNQTPATKINKILEIVEQEFEKQQIEKHEQRKYRSYFKNFQEWTVSQGLGNVASNTELDRPKKINIEDYEKERLHAAPGQARRDWNATGAGSKSRHGREKKSIYRLGSISGDYFNPSLSKDLEEYSYFRKNTGCSDATLKKEISECYQILGWLHRYASKKVSLDDLRLTSIIYYSPLDISILDCEGDYQKWLTEKLKAKHQANLIAKANLEIIKEFIDFISENPRSKHTYIGTIIAVAKFIFRRDIGTEEYSEDRDIPIIKMLKTEQARLSALVKKAPYEIPFHEKSIPWEEAIWVMEKLRLRAEREYQKPFVRDGCLSVNKRTVLAMERDLQAFLSVAFMVVIPPDRARTYYELELGKTLVRGKFKDSHFYPSYIYDSFADSTWYIHLMPNEYKTGKFYKESWVPIPNVEFPDGKRLYDYIHDWLVNYRERKGSLNHNFFFRGTNNHEPMNSNRWGGQISNIFDRETGVPVYPHQLRSMFVSYLNANGASISELKAAAQAMHHSLEMQESIYNKLETLKKVAPAIDFCLKTLNKVADEFKNHTKDFETMFEEERQQREVVHREQTKLGIAKAQMRGVHCGRKPQHNPSDDKSSKVIEMYQSGIALREITSQLHMNKNTVKRIIEEYGIE